MKMKVFFQYLPDLLYPKCCPFCGTVMPFMGAPVCNNCLSQLKRVSYPQCLRCGKTIENEDLAYCNDCSKNPKSFVRGFPVFEYTGGVKKAIYDFKYNNQRSFGQVFADCMYACYKRELEQLGIDGLVPVPIHKKKRRKRGFNQAEILAYHLGNRMNVPVFPKLLRRVINTNPQKELSDKARMKNLKNAFIIGTNKIKLKKVLLVDDIYTTGATIEACTKVLLASGVEEVYYISLAIGRGF